MPQIKLATFESPTYTSGSSLNGVDGWSADAGFVAGTGWAFAGAQGAHSTSGATGVNAVWAGGTDGSGGNQQVVTYARGLTGGTSDQLWFFSNVTGNSGATLTSASYYAFNITFTQGARLIRTAAGSSTTPVAFFGAAAFASGVTYRITATVSPALTTGTVTVQVQRLSDNQYLTAAGAWQAGATNCISYNDAAPLANGNATFGYQIINFSGADDWYIDNAELDATATAQVSLTTFEAPTFTSGVSINGLGGWASDAGFVAGTGWAFAGAQAAHSSSGTTGVNATWTGGTDGNGGYQQVITYARAIAGTTSSQLYIRFNLTGNSGNTITTASCYLFNIAIGSGARLFREAAGTAPVAVAFFGAAAFAAGVTYKITCTSNPSLTTGTVTVQVQRLSDNQYLTAAGAWQAGATNCISYNDAAPLANGNATFGYGITNGSAADDWYIDNAELDAPVAAGALAVGPLAFVQPNAANQTAANFTLSVSGGTPPYSTQLQRAPTQAGTYANVGSAASGAAPAPSHTGLAAGAGGWYRAVVTDSASGTATTAAVFGGTPGNYYVATAGSNANAGTSAAPFATLNGVLTGGLVVDGSTYNVADGTYTETVQWSLSGSFALGVKFQGSGGSSSNVTITGSSTTDANVLQSGAVANLTLQDLKFASRAGSLGAVKFQQQATNVLFTRCAFTAASGGSGTYGFFGSYAAGSYAVNGLVFDTCTFAETAADWLGRAFYLTSVDPGTIRGLVVRSSTLTSAGIASLALNGVDDCQLLANTYTTSNGANGVAGYAIIIGADATAGSANNRVLIEDGVASCDKSHGVLLGAWCSGSVLRRLRVSGAGNYAVVVKESGGVLVEDCWLETANPAGATGAALYFKAATDCIARGNTLVASSSVATTYAFQINQGDSQHQAARIRAYNNRLVARTAASCLNMLLIGSGNYLDRNVYDLAGTGSLGNAPGASGVATIAALQAAWASYDTPVNDANSVLAGDPSLTLLTMAHADTNTPVYVTIQEPGGKYWDGETFMAGNASTWHRLARRAAEVPAASGTFARHFPPTVKAFGKGGNYAITWYIAGATGIPASSDTVLGTTSVSLAGGGGGGGGPRIGAALIG